jgi:hypothetical protein
MIFSFPSTRLGEQLLAVKGLFFYRFGFYKKKRVAVLNFGNPAICKRPVAFRPRLATRLAFSQQLLSNYHDSLCLSSFFYA